MICSTSEMVLINDVMLRCYKLSSKIRLKKVDTHSLHEILVNMLRREDL